MAKQSSTQEIRPNYYTSTEISALDVIDDWGLDFRLGNVVKYFSRLGKKPGAEVLSDLRKARTYITLKIEQLEKAAKQ